jgi:hypothetical protein
MVIVYGSRLYGRIDDCNGTYIATRFAHIYYLPLIPLGSQLILGHDDEDDSFHGVSISLSLRSMFAGYLRVWGVFGFIGSLIALVLSIRGAMNANDATDDIVNLIEAGFIFVIAIAMMGFAWGVLGRLSSEEKRKRVVYKHFTGISADPAQLKDARTPIRESLFQKIGERAQGLAQTGYRMQVNPMTHWMQIALDPNVQDADFIGAAFTLARLETSFLAGPPKAQMEMTHHALWTRVLQVAPPPQPV